MRMPTVTTVKVSGLGDDLVLPHYHISLGPGLTALVNCIVFYSELKTRKIMFTKQSEFVHI